MRPAKPKLTRKLLRTVNAMYAPLVQGHAHREQAPAGAARELPFNRLPAEKVCTPDLPADDQDQQ
jgi:mono/diheme cytochrome c family protein